jgi:5-methylcytosine-specific restriction endonuclease McrA
MADTLILNSDGSPLGLLPLASKPWQKVIDDIWTNKVQVLHTYEDWIVRSPSIAMNVPSVVLLNQFKKPKRVIRFTKHNLLLRDRYTCQYCSAEFPFGQLTYDHVVPHSHGGGKNWENIVAACQPCNGRRGNNTKIVPNRLPYRPTYWELVGRAKEYPLHVPHASWAYYLDWPQNLLTIRSR